MTLDVTARQAVKLHKALETAFGAARQRIKEAECDMQPFPQPAQSKP